jgi:hypothetical protein
MCRLLNVRKAEIARQLGVDRGWITQLSAGGRNRLMGGESDWPAPISPGEWCMDDVREFLRRRARSLRPSASFCSNCGGRL